MNAHTSTFTEAEQKVIVANAFAMPGLATGNEEDIGKQMLRAEMSVRRAPAMSPDHRRAKIVEFIKANPGARYADIRDEMGISDGTLANDLKKLRTKKLIKARGQGWSMVAAKPPKVSRRTTERLDRLEAVADLIAGRHMSIQQVADHFGASRYAARCWLLALEEQGRAIRMQIDQASKPPLHLFTAPERAAQCDGGREA